MMTFLTNRLSINRIVRVKPTQTIVIGFAAIIFIGSVLLNLPVASKDGQSIGIMNAIFTATSATCVTGLVIADTYTQWTLFGQIVILTLIQIGGLGFMTMATLFSFILRRKISLRERLIIVESLNQYNLQGVIRLIKKVLIGTFLFEGIGAIILSWRFAGQFGIVNGIYKGVFHAVSAFCNAGFDLMGQHENYSSLTLFADDMVVNLVVMFLIVVGGLGFAVWDDLYRTRSFKELHLHSKLVLSVTFILILLGFIAFFALEYNNQATIGLLNDRGKILAAMFQSVTPRTAGFNTINLTDMRNASLFTTMLLMFVGGSPGSTAGGIKTTTAGVLIFTVIAVIRGKDDTEMFKRRLSHAAVTRAFTITFISFMLVALITMVLSIFENVTLVEALFEAVSAFGTVGLSLGITPDLSLIGKVTVIITMFFGRVGVLTIALALLSKSHKNYNSYRYKEEKIIV